MAGTGQIEITAIRPDTHFVPGQAPVPGYRIEFVTPSGVRSNLTIPRSETLPDDVKQAVMAEAARLEAVLNQPYGG